MPYVFFFFRVIVWVLLCPIFKRNIIIPLNSTNAASAQLWFLILLLFSQKKIDKKCSIREVNLIENVFLESLWQYWFFHKPLINHLSVCCAGEHESPRLPRTLCAAEWRNRASVSGHRTLKLQATRDVTLVTTSNCNGWNIVVYRHKKKKNSKNNREAKGRNVACFPSLN